MLKCLQESSPLDTAMNKKLKKLKAEEEEEEKRAQTRQTMLSVSKPAQKGSTQTVTQGKTEAEI